ncbi:choline ABC transporter substrate-binding protein [Agrobacterium rubi]|uniref:Choline ABC transporter substrate-binding protein n=2 Tax=Agrobacterium rubi TaxID=28099 RepID=A0AAE7UQ77_9HYPH|nr:choline ABC transporter substrate-binding protein [Agrobacterium rubi]MBP1878730.1 glycine betaine/proline transport system substrate-binding protein [Agrobacterium rubi]MCL6652909.1 glycine/betaine ABC transporter substrate-binding protein [Agrobacterium rubi]NTE88647.1 choline ABC transporter substrate-binding protein [Agrobacterium rubi]NTF04475.1 choline ABC transporter substrate-binding protein [Agrobacterium rubi]NTF10008.1 choline ABC transporter substrate-binding protein [Agrobacter
MNKKSRIGHITSGLFFLVAAFAGHAQAADDAACKTIRLSDPGWTDITATNGVASVVLGALGYEPDVKTLSVPIGYQAMKNGEIDVFLGNWMPAQKSFIDDLNAAKAVEVIGQNLEGAKFTLAVPSYMADKGIKDFADLSKHADEFDKKIYGIEPGAPANQNIQKIIADEKFGLKDWELVESGEQAMLSQVERAGKSKKGVVFLAWAPHPMNEKFSIEYLSGGDDYFGPNFGGAQVYTLARTGWTAQCPNATALLKNLKFDVGMENKLMGDILGGQTATDAATAWLKANPKAIDSWLSGVTTLDGKPGDAAVKAAVGL